MSLATIVALIGEIGAVIGVIVPVILSVKKIANGTRCQLRSEMLRLYYKHRENEQSTVCELVKHKLTYGNKK